MLGALGIPGMGQVGNDHTSVNLTICPSDSLLLEWTHP